MVNRPTMGGGVWLPWQSPSSQFLALPSSNRRPVPRIDEKPVFSRRLFLCLAARNTVLEAKKPLPGGRREYQMEHFGNKGCAGGRNSVPKGGENIYPFWELRVSSVG